ncbi:hypothetical protein JCM1840_007480 [Sporobolomyces johnsonii]
MRWSLAFLALGASIAVTAPTSSGPSVTTTYGTWNGGSASGVDYFKGIPFAQPPTGNLRFAPPVADSTNHGAFDATQFGYACPQMSLAAGVLPGTLNDLGVSVTNLINELPGFSSVVASNASEDCLSLNVFRPAGTTSSSKLPVLVWIFGGGFLFGGSSTYDPTSLILQSVSLNQPIVYVSINYRLNSFGFLPGAEVAADPTASVNAGLMDQRLALEWIQQNIAAFGGDATKVTLSGESAGAISSSLQMLAYGGDITSNSTGNPLFRAVICESGSPLPVGPASYGQSSFDAVAEATDCDTASDKIACLRAVPYAQLLAATNTLGNLASYRSVSLPFLPRTDGDFIPDLPQNLERAGKYAQVPIISGDQYDEGTVLALGTLNITTAQQVNDYFSTIFFPRAPQSDIAALLDYYPQDPTQGSPFDTGLLNVITPQNKRINAIIGDLVFQAPRRAFMGYTNATQPTWSYASRALRATPLLGTFHTSDLLAVYALDPAPPSAEMQSRWIAFVNNLDPNVAGYPYWPQYGNNATLLQFTDSTSSIIPDTYRAAGIAYIWSVADDFTF